MKSLIDALLSHKTTQAGRTFAYFLKEEVWEEITYSQIYERSCAYANLYRSRGIKPGSVILIILQHSPELFYAFIGALLCGCIPSFMPFPSVKQDPYLYWASHRLLFSRIGAGALVTYSENEDALRENIQNLLLQLLKPEDAASQPAEFEPHLPNLDDIAFLQHSSGTTGLKKGVALSYRSVAQQVSSYANTLGLTDSDRIATWLPLYHDMGLIASFILPLTLAIPIVMIDPFEWAFDPVILLDAIEKYRCTYTWIPNFAFHHLCRTVGSRQKYDLSSMKAFIDCSEPCKPETFDLFLETFAHCGVRRENLQVCYAMAETVFAVTQTAHDQPVNALPVDYTKLVEHQRVVPPENNNQARRILSVGVPIPGLAVRITGKNGETLSDDMVGEVTISGNCLFSGYFKLPEETEKKLRQGWYYSGDMGFLHAGELYITGRKNDLIIVHGKNYYAHDIEFIVNTLEGLKPGRNVAFGVYNPTVGSEEVVVVAETNVKDRVKWIELGMQVKKTIFEQLSLLLQDIKVVSPGWLVKTTSGKISRSENRKKYLTEIAEGFTDLDIQYMEAE